MNNIERFLSKNSITHFEELNLRKKRIEEMLEYSSSDDFYKYLETTKLKSFSEVRNYIISLKKRIYIGYESGESKYQFIIDNLENKMIGTAGFVGINHNRKSACVALGLSEKFRSNARGIEVLLRLLNYGFNELKLSRIWLITNQNNLPVLQTHKLFGFENCGILKQYYYVDGKYVNAIYMSCLKKDFIASKAIGLIKLIRK